MPCEFCRLGCSGSPGSLMMHVDDWTNWVLFSIIHCVRNCWQLSLVLCRATVTTILQVLHRAQHCTCTYSSRRCQYTLVSTCLILVQYSHPVSVGRRCVGVMQEVGSHFGAAEALSLTLTRLLLCSHCTEVWQLASCFHHNFWCLRHGDTLISFVQIYLHICCSHSLSCRRPWQGWL